METKAQKTIDQSNDGTFNIVVHYRYYNDDKYFAVIKNGGLATANSVGKPVYKLVTNIGGKDHVITCDSLSDAFKRIEDDHKHLEQLPDTTQAKIKPILKSLLGNYMFLTNHTTDQILDNIKKASDEIISNPHSKEYIKLNKLLQTIKANNKDVSNKVQYNISVRAFDQLYELAYKMVKNNPQAKKIVDQIVMYNNLIARY